MDMEGVNIDEFNAEYGDTTSTSLYPSEVEEVRDLLTNLPRLEETLHTLRRDQTTLTDTVAAFATRVERRHHETVEQANRTNQLLQEVIEQMQQFSNRSYTTMRDHSEGLTEMREGMEQMRAEIQAQHEELTDLRAAVSAIQVGSNETGANVANNSELYPEWDVLGRMPANTPTYSVDELELRLSKILKQNETPTFGGADNEDIEVYVLNMISWYGAFGLFFGQLQVDFRVGQLMMNHTKGEAKVWLLQEYSGEWRWSLIVKKMRQRFLTKSREEDRVARLFDCTQGSRTLDKYIEEFLRLARTEEVSVKFKLILFKKGLQSQELRNFLQTKQYTTLEELMDAARTMNPRAPPADPNNKRSAKQSGPGAQESAKSRSKAAPNKFDKKPDASRCTASHCTEQGHARDKCWQMHPELQPKWLKNKNNAATTASTPAPNGGNDQLLKMMAALQADMAKIKADLN
ncbi:hypothetical protein ON010_g4906 [Phytophthora cinnamomi]|nr:hypothetical protein ON010_g4906 [Phytophthora cinnamomi]